MSKRRLVIAVLFLVVIIALPMIIPLIVPRLARRVFGTKPRVAAVEGVMLAQLVELWIVDNGHSRLPDNFALSMLTQGAEPYLRAKDLTDPWDTPYIVASVDSGGFTIISCGPDGRLHTSDDVRRTSE